MDIYSINVKRYYASHAASINKHLSCLTYRRASAKGSNPVVTPKKNSDPLKQFQSSLAQKASISDIFQCIWITNIKNLIWHWNKTKVLINVTIFLLLQAWVLLKNAVQSMGPIILLFEMTFEKINKKRAINIFPF